MNTWHPIIPSSGEKQLYETDYADNSPHPLSVQRNYMSQLAQATGFGANWNWGYIVRLEIDTNQIPAMAKMQLADGSIKNFRSSPATGGWTSFSPGTLTQATSAAGATSYLYKPNESDSQYSFNAEGKLVSHTHRNGWTMQYAYNAAGQLTAIINHFGRSLQLAYHTNGQFAQITTPDNQVIRYEYDDSLRLSIVRYADNTSRQYLYENLTHSHLLTGVVDENGIRLSSYRYDARGRAIETTKAANIDRFQVSYGASSANQITSATITDPLGTERTYNYKTALNSLAVIGADKPSSQGLADAASRVLDSWGFIEIETDFLGITNQFTWDTTRNLKTQEHRASNSSAQEITEIQWHPTFRLPKKTIERGLTTDFTYDALGNLLTQLETDSRASGGSTRTWVYTYSPQNLPLTLIDSRGQLWSFEHDAQGNRTRITNPLGQASNFTYDNAGRMLTEAAPNGLVTSYTYDARGRLMRITRGSNLAAALQQTTAYTYRPSGQIAAASLPHGHALSYQYDDAQRLIGITDNRGNQIAYTLDAMGNRLSEQIKESSGQIAWATSRVINSLNRLQSISGATSPAQQTSAFLYDANGELIQATDPLGHTTKTRLDAMRRPADITLADDSVVSFVHDQFGFLQFATDPKRLQTRFEYNAWGELLQEYSRHDIGFVTYTRDKSGNILTKKDEKNQITSYQYDALSRVTNITFADGKQQAFFYDGTATGQQIGTLREMTDASGSTQYERDSFGRITKKTQTVLDNPANPTVLISQYTYTPAGELASMRYPSGLTVGYQRNASGQISGLTTKQGSAAALPFVQNLSYTALEQPKAWNWAHCTTASAAISPCTAASRSFDADGRMTSSNLAAYQYDAASRITAITQNLIAQRSVPASSGTATVTQLYTQPVSWTVGYDNRNRITSFTRSFSGSGQQAASSESFTYDPNSNRLSSISIAARDTDKDGQYETSEQRSSTTRILAIQPTSNKLQGFTQTLTSLTGNTTTSNVTSQINYTLDANGNLTSDGLRDFQYDGSDRLSKVILGSTFVGTDSIAGNELAQHSYLHNAAGQRVFKSEPKTEATAPNEATLGTGFVDWLRTNFSWLWQTAQTNATLGDSFLYADGQLPSWALLGQYGNGGASSTGRTEYIWLPTSNGSAIPVGLYRAGQLHAIHTDHLGTPRLMVDRNNTPVWQWAYSAFGDNAPTGILKPTTSAASAFISMPAGSNGNTSVTLLATSTPVQINNLRFPGQYADSETGQFYNYFRTYMPNQGRYTQNDPIGLDGGWNRFGYASADPFGNYDPYGLFELPSIPQPVVDFGAGMGDTILFGQGQRARDFFGVDGGVDQCSDAYDYGEWAGVAGSLATGLAGGLKAAGTKGAGKEFSHWIPNRMGGPRSTWNGNFVPTATHALSDPYRYRFMPKPWKAQNPMPNAASQQLTRIPNAYKGGAAGGAYGAAGAAQSGCTCRR